MKRKDYVVLRERMQQVWDEKRGWIIAGGALALLVLIFLCGLIFSLRNRGQEEASLMPTQQPTALPSPAPSSTPFMVVIDTWYVASLVDEGYEENGVKYDLATFINRADPSKVIRARCDCMTCPDPEIGHDYRLVDFEKEVPEVGDRLIPSEGEESPLQDFIVLP